jgi:hypothetical protein
MHAPRWGTLSAGVGVGGEHGRRRYWGRVEQGIQGGLSVNTGSKEGCGGLVGESRGILSVKSGVSVAEAPETSVACIGVSRLVIMRERERHALWSCGRGKGGQTG